jgi:CHAD domain-containing protein
MKKRKTASVIRQRFDKINKTLAKITVDFGSKDIHDFRVEFKKIRAFLRLAASDRATGGRLHHFYHIAGFIRNLQLQQQRIGEEWENKDHPPQSYLDLLNEEKSARIELAKNYARKKLSIEKEQQRALTTTPPRLSKAASRRFSRSAAAHLEQLSGARPIADDSMHEIRKRLKDLSYNQPFINKEAALILPASLLTREKLHIILDALGEFQDLRSGLALLQPYYLDRITDTQERAALEALKKKWEEEKERRKKDLYVLLTQSIHPQLNSTFLILQMNSKQK